MLFIYFFVYGAVCVFFFLGDRLVQAINKPFVYPFLLDKIDNISGLAIANQHPLPVPLVLDAKILAS